MVEATSNSSQRGTPREDLGSLKDNGNQQERWIPTVCTMCDSGCMIQVRVKDGIANAIKGNPGVPPNYGKMCAKGKSALAELYAPGRVVRPLKRTNGKKGLDEDPMWKEISWEEALDNITARLKQTREENPLGFSITTFDFPIGTTVFRGAYGTAFGGPKYGGVIPQASALFCGNGAHPVSYMVTGSDDPLPDLTHCRYLLVFGGGFGTGTGHHAIPLARRLADAKSHRGLKMVVVDPCRASAASRADEWIPIIPGTDAAICLSMANVLVNELGIYDERFLKHYTNSNYLIRADGHYLRDRQTHKPLVLSKSKEGPVPYDDVDFDDTVLEGEVVVEGKTVTTAFVALREHLKKYTPEFSASVTSVPATTIRRIAKEFGEAAQVGGGTMVDGAELPLRPACAIWYRGLGQHQHGLHMSWAAAMLNIVVGAVDVPGGLYHCGSTGAWGLPVEGPDGLLQTTNPFQSMLRSLPIRDVHFDPTDADLIGMFPVASYSLTMAGVTLRNPEKHRLDYKLDFWVCVRANPMKSSGAPEETAEILEKIPFQVSFVRHLDETSQFADIVLPDTHYLERLVPFAHTPGTHFYHSPMADEKEWVCGIQQPVVEPMGESRNWYEVLWDLAHRAGFEDDLYSALNVSVPLDPNHRMRRDRHYTYQDFCDMWMRSWCGEDHGLEYFRRYGWVQWDQERTIAHRYPRIFHDGRIPLYLEHWLVAGEKVKEVVAREGIEWGDISDYSAMVDYRPCWASQEGGEAFPLYLVNPKVGYLTLNTSTIKNPLLQEIAAATGEIFNVGIHPALASDLGIANGDLIEIESSGGKKVTAEARLTKDVHPKVISAAGNVSKVLTPDGKDVLGYGVHLNEFISYRLERIDMLSSALDACVKVRIKKIQKERAGPFGSLSRSASDFFRRK